MVRVKICGITNSADAELACNFGAAAIGLNFFPESPRAVSPFAARSIVERLPPFVSAVGVFVNWQADVVIALSSALGLTAAQLHGDETPAVVGRVSKKIPVIKALRIAQADSSPQFARFREASAFLLDAAHPGQYGGTGTTANWHLARAAAQSHRILLAGGLTPENVGEAIRIVRPYAVDVASGVESRPGRKDPARLRAFFDEVARANRELD